MSDKRYSSPFPKELSACVERLTRPVLKAQGLAGSRLITHWHEIVGPALANRCVPQKLSYPKGKTTDGTLTISVENGFATELQHMQPAILEKLASYLGYKAVARIVISHAYKPLTTAISPVRKKASTPGVAIKLPENIEDDELKNALQSLAETLSGSGA